jgi:hypothetical protein
MSTIQDIDREAARRVARVLEEDMDGAGMAGATVDDASASSTGIGSHSLPPSPRPATRTWPGLPRILSLAAVAGAIAGVLAIIENPGHRLAARGSLIGGGAMAPRDPPGVPQGHSGSLSMQKRPIGITAPGAALATRAAAAAATVHWPAEFGGNGHWYRLVIVDGPISWSDARAHALGQGGDLATFTSEAETSQFLAHLAAAGAHSPWIGLFQDTSAPDYSEPAGGWRWVSGEPLDWRNWMRGEPNEMSGNENFANMWLNQSAVNGSWNDYSFGSRGSPAAFIIEWPRDPSSGPSGARRP